MFANVILNIDDVDRGASNCVLYLRELHEIPNLEASFKVYKKGGFEAYWGQDQRKKLINELKIINKGLFEFIGNHAVNYSKVFKGNLEWPPLKFKSKNRDNEKPYIFHDVNKLPPKPKSGFGRRYESVTYPAVDARGSGKFDRDVRREMEKTICFRPPSSEERLCELSQSPDEEYDPQPQSSKMQFHEKPRSVNSRLFENRALQSSAGRQRSLGTGPPKLYFDPQTGKLLSAETVNSRGSQASRILLQKLLGTGVPKRHFDLMTGRFR